MMPLVQLSLTKTTYFIISQYSIAVKIHIKDPLTRTIYNIKELLLDKLTNTNHFTLNNHSYRITVGDLKMVSCSTYQYDNAWSKL